MSVGRHSTINELHATFRKKFKIAPKADVSNVLAAVDAIYDSARIATDCLCCTNALDRILRESCIIRIAWGKISLQLLQFAYQSATVSPRQPKNDIAMLKHHFDACERAILAASAIPANSGHSIHKGTPRENLIANFLTDHLSANVAIGSGEIIDHQSSPGEARNQHDIVIYRKNYPKLNFGGGVSGFLVESVIATIEVKSVLDYEGMKDAISAATRLKKLSPQLIRHAAIGWIPPKPLSFVVAYDGPAKLDTAQGWMARAESELGLEYDVWPTDRRLSTPGNGVDAFAILGKGAYALTNTPLFGHDIPSDVHHWRWETEAGSLLILFLSLQHACLNFESAHLNTGAYLKGQRPTGQWVVTGEGAGLQPTTIEQRLG